MKGRSRPKISSLHVDHPGRLGTKIVYFSDIGRRNLVDETGFIGGVYINTAQEIEREDINCDTAEGCKEPLVSLESRIHWALDGDHDCYPLEDIYEEDAEVGGMISATNLRVLLCLTHKTIMAMPLKVEEDAESGRIYRLPGRSAKLRGVGLLANDELLIRLTNAARAKLERTLCGKVTDMGFWKSIHRKKPGKR